MTKNNCPSRNELSGYANGTLPPSAAEEVTEHIAECTACEDTLQNLGQTADGLLRQIQAKPAAERFVEEPACRQAVSYVEGQAPPQKDRRKARLPRLPQRRAHQHPVLLLPPLTPPAPQRRSEPRL